MHLFKRFLILFSIVVISSIRPSSLVAQELPLRYLTLELFTNTPCSICGSQNPGLFSRLGNYEGEYHLISFYPGTPYSNCIFYQANIAGNTARLQFYPGSIFGTPTVGLNGVDFKSSSGVTNTVLNGLTGGTSWLHVDVEETAGSNRTVTINLEDVVGGSLATGRLFAVIVEREIMYNAPNGETVHHNVFRRFLTNTAGEEVNMTSGAASLTFDYEVDNDWNADETYVIAWLSDPTTKEIYNSGTRFDPDFTSAIVPVQAILPLSLYPNPASTHVNLMMPSDIITAAIQVYDHSGRMVHTVQVNGMQEIKIPVADFPAGRYVINMLDGKKVYSGSFEVLK